MTEQDNTHAITSWAVFKAMVKRDLLVQIRDKWEFVFRVAMLPFMLILLYGYILPRIGLVSSDFPNQMFPGIVGMSILVTGIHGTAIPLTMDFNVSREIEDRLMAPVNVGVVALAKMCVGIIEAWVGGLIVLPLALIFMGSTLDLTLTLQGTLLLLVVVLLASLSSATLGLLVGTIIKPSQVAAMFPGFLIPLVFLGSVFFSWNTLNVTPIIQVLVLLNPLVYVNEALRAILTPQLPHMSLFISMTGILISILIMGYWGRKRFIKMATGN